MDSCSIKIKQLYLPLQMAIILIFFFRYIHYDFFVSELDCDFPKRYKAFLPLRLRKTRNALVQIWDIPANKKRPECYLNL